MIDIALTPNRADCLGVHGIARDLAAAGVGTLKPLDTDAGPRQLQQPDQVAARSRRPDKGDACPYVVGRYFRNVKNGPSPKWLQDRLTAIGLRPISALVDITNYVTFDLGRPLHVFDAEESSQGDLTMRLARAGREILALDGKTYELDPEMTVIADAHGPHGIGGIMGGEATGCATTPRRCSWKWRCSIRIRTAATGRKLGIESDARYRFERGVDPDLGRLGRRGRGAPDPGDSAAARPARWSSAGAMPEWQRTLALAPRRASARSAASICRPAESQRILARSASTSTGGDA